jgi:hypothetical protein
MNQIIRQEIDKATQAMFPHGAGQANHVRVQHWLDKVATVAFRQGRDEALLGIMTAEDLADHFDITPRRARALIQNRHERFGVGMKAGNCWLIHRDELPSLQPDKKYG